MMNLLDANLLVGNKMKYTHRIDFKKCTCQGRINKEVFISMPTDDKEWDQVMKIEYQEKDGDLQDILYFYTPKGCIHLSDLDEETGLLGEGKKQILQQVLDTVKRPQKDDCMTALAGPDNNYIFKFVTN